MAKKLLLTVCLLGFSLYYLSQADSARFFVTPHVSPSLKFTENLGQWADHILFKARLDGGAMYLEKQALTFDFYDKKKMNTLHHGGIGQNGYTDSKIKRHAYRVLFEGCNPDAVVEKLQAGSEYENFYLGNDESKWKSDVKNYHQVWLRNLYNNIDYEVFTATGKIKYNFHVKAGANASAIKLRYEGVDKLKLKDGVLHVGLSINSVAEQKPFAYQMINGKVVVVVCKYKLNANVLSFDFPNSYNKDYELIIDPVLVFAAQSGSSADNWGSTATFDNQGNLYAGGTCEDNGYPVTLGAYDNSFNGGAGVGQFVWDIVVSKYNANGTALIYSTYLGGSFVDVISSMIVDYSNNLCLYGATGSANFPMVTGAYDNTFNGGSALVLNRSATEYPNGTDIYIAKFNSGGTALLASTYLGGTGNDGVNHMNTQAPIPWNPSFSDWTEDSLCFNYGDQNRGEIQVDITNNIYITSSTRSTNFPTVNAFDNSLGGRQDAIVAKFNSNLSQLIFSTYLGGGLNDCGNSLIVNDNLEVYVTGGTCSSNFPATTGAFSTNYNGGKADGFIAHFNAAGNQVLQATYVGTSNYDNSFFIQTDKYHDIYVYGQSLGSMPVMRVSPPGLPFNNPGTHQFINRFDKNLSVRNLSTVFGSKTSDTDISPCAFAVDKCQNIYLSGWGGRLWPGELPMGNMPMFQPTQANTTGFDFYFMGLDSNFVLKYGSYFGGGLSEEHVDGGTSRFDPRGRIYQSACAGCGGHDDWPVTPGAWPNTPGNSNHNANCNNGVVKLDFQLQMSIATINTQTFAGCAPMAVSFTSATQPTNPGATYKWYLDLANNITTTTNPNPSITYTAPGIYTVSLVINDNLTCNKKDSTITFITVYDSPTTNFAVLYDPCATAVALTHTTSGNLSATQPYAWNFGDNASIFYSSTPTHTYLNNGTYNITFTVTNTYGCKVVKTQTVSVIDFAPKINDGATLCSGSSTTLNASGGTNYSWQPATFLDNPGSPAPVSTPTAPITYTVNVTYTTASSSCSKALTAQLNVNPTPTTAFSYSYNSCGGGVNFTDQSASEITSWFWTLTPAKTATVQNPYNFYDKGGTYTISLVSTNVFGCKSGFSDVITVVPPPPLSISGPTQICVGKSAQLNVTGGVGYRWIPPSGLDMPLSSSPIASPVSSTEYSVVVTTTKSVNGNPCEFILTSGVDVSILSSKPINATANPPIVIVGDPSTLTYRGDPGATVYWDPPTKPAIGYTVLGYPIKPTTYTVVAVKGACSETTQVHVDAYTKGCLDNDVFIPNTFTPNGDGQNDLLYVRGIKVDEVYFAVYNRWGELVFETTDKTRGWDGAYKGKQTDVGVFGWYLKVKCFNGEETFRKGNVTLLR